MARPQYRLTTNSFFAPHYVKAGTVIEFDGPPGPHMEPANAEAKAVLKKYYEDNPGATINPVENLAMTMNVVTPAAPVQNVLSVGTLGDPGKPIELADLLAVPQTHPGTAGGAIVTPDPKGIGSNAPTAEGTLEPVPGTTGSFTQTEGDPSKPGEGKNDAAQKAAADKANAKATDVAKDK